MDFARDTRPEVWLPRLQGVDAVINAVGVLRDSRSRPMDAVHRDTPIAPASVPWCSETLAMLGRDNVGDPGRFEALLGHAAPPAASWWPGPRPAGFAPVKSVLTGPSAAEGAGGTPIQALIRC